MKRPRKVKALLNEPIEIPQPENLPEIKQLPEPVIPALYPDENPLVKPPIEQPIENQPYQVPKPSEFALK